MPPPDPELEARVLRRIAQEYKWQNITLFDGKLTPPVFALTDHTSQLGSWQRIGRRLTLSRLLVFERKWLEVVEVLKHEMAHQFVDEVLGVHDETAHGPTFAQVCKERGIDPRATGAIQIKEDEAYLRIVERIHKLLALAGSSERHEAELAMRKAHELMLRYNIDALKGGSSSYAIAQLGDPNKKRSNVEREIVALLTRYFFVEAIEVPAYAPKTGREGSVFEICGTPQNVAMAEHVFSFLSSTAERLWQEVRKERKLDRKERLPFQMGVIRGFAEKLEAERQALRGSGLVWVKDGSLEAFRQARHPRVRQKFHRMRISEGHRLGKEAGRAIILHKPIESKGGSLNPLLLTAGTQKPSSR
ncbi:MAG: DUF2786 domain-containing protein [Deltaproteobacteria bacterium]|nr:DUF2786 domain-containing protein [Deltaproteobacteria bacterium]